MMYSSCAGGRADSDGKERPKESGAPVAGVLEEIQAGPGGRPLTPISPFSCHLSSKVAASLVMRQLCWLAAAAVGQKEYFTLKVSLAAQTFDGNLTGDDFTKTPGDKSWMSEMCVCPLGMLSYA